MEAIAAGNHTATTLIGILASLRIATAADRAEFYDRYGRQPAHRGDLIDELTEPVPADAAEGETKAHERKIQTWARGNHCIDKLRTTLIGVLTQEMQHDIERNPVPRREIVDIIDMIRREHVAILPSTVVERWIKELEAPLLPDTTIDAAIQTFTSTLNDIPEHERPRNHHVVNHFLRKLRGEELAAVNAALAISHPTDQTRFWNDAIKATIRDQILGAREHTTRTVGQALANNAINTEAEPAAQAPSANAAAATTHTRPTHFCFEHGRCGHTSFQCTKMATDYGDFRDANNSHIAKFLCTTAGQNVDGVTSSTRGPNTRQDATNRDRNRRRRPGRG